MTYQSSRIRLSECNTVYRNVIKTTSVIHIAALPKWRRRGSWSSPKEECRLCWWLKLHVFSGQHENDRWYLRSIVRVWLDAQQRNVDASQCLALRISVKRLVNHLGNRPFCPAIPDITKEIHKIMIIRIAVPSPRYYFEDQHTKAKNIDLGWHISIYCILGCHITECSNNSSRPCMSMAFS